MNNASNGSRVGKNALMLGVGNLLSRAMGVILYILLARYLGPKQYGVYNIAISFIQIFVLLTNFGLDVVYIRDVSRDRSLSSSYFYSGFSLKIALSIASFIILVIIARILNYNTLVFIAIMTYGISITFQAVLELISSVFKAIESMKYVSYIIILRSFFAISLITYLILLQKDVIAILIAQNASFVLIALLFIFVLVKKDLITQKFSLNWSLCPLMIKMSLPFIFIGILHIINFRTDIIMLSLLTNETLAGYYSAANEFIITLYILPNIISTALFPALSKHFGRDPASITEMSNFSSKLLIAIGVPMGIGLFILAPNIVDFVLGPQYGQSVIAMRILSIGITLTYARLIFSWLLTAVNLEKYALREYALCLAINLLLNAILIPRYQIKGAAIATVVSAVVGNSYLYLKSRRVLRDMVFLKYYIKPLLCAGIMAIILSYMPFFNVVVLVLVGSVSYFAAAITFSVFSRQEYALLLKGFKRS